MKRLIQFFDSDYYGKIEGLFIYDEDEWNLLQKLIKRGKKLYIGEACGKHSECYLNLAKIRFHVRSIDQEFVNKLEQTVGSHLAGYDPLEHYDEDEDDYEDDDD